MPSRAISVILFTAALLTGCARSRITTEIKPDGSWLRTVAFTGAEKKEGQMTPTIEDSFVMPSGSEWKSRVDKKSEDRILTFSRSMALGASLRGDLSVKGGEPGKLNLVNEVTVTQSGPGRFEYRETLLWKGEPPEAATIKPETLQEIKAALPQPLATDANARALATKGQLLLVPLMFGPGDPLLALGLIHPDLAERRASQRIGALIVKLLEDQFGSQMSLEQRREVARKLISTSLSSSRPSQPDPTSGEKPGKNGGLTPLMFIVRVPGRIVSSNGEVDEFTGEVYWALFPEAASLKNVVMTAICEPGQK